jgi:hypothetical protein
LRIAQVTRLRLGSGSWAAVAGLALGLGAARTVGWGSENGTAVTWLAEPHCWARLSRRMRVLPPGLARGLNRAVNLALAQAGLLSRPRQCRQKIRLAVVQGPAARPVQGGIPVALNLAGHEPHQMLKVLQLAVTVPGRRPGGPLRLQV